jgi:hypothetical protein
MFKFRFAALVVFAAATLHAQTVAEGARLPVTGAPLPMDVLVESPAAAPGELQVICLFRSEPENKLTASLALLDSKLGGALTQVRKPTLFRGDLGETLLLTPPAGEIAAKRLLIVGLGDRASFTVANEELVGSIVYTESERLGIAAPSFAPTLLDGGKTGLGTGEVGAAFLRGFLRARATAQTLAAAKQVPELQVKRLTFLAGTTHALDTQRGLAGSF